MDLVYLSPEREAAIKRNIPWDRIDSRIRSLIWRFNQVSGIATTQSCAGHVKSIGDGAFRVSEASVALFVTKVRFEELLQLIPGCGITDIDLRYFSDGTFWMCFGWPPESYEPAYKLTRILLGDEWRNGDKEDEE